jgi:hypothetical protein
VCGPFFANVWVARDKFLKLVKGETRSMTYRAQNRHQYQDRRVQVDLPALQHLSLMYSERWKANKPRELAYLGVGVPAWARPLRFLLRLASCRNRRLFSLVF